MILLAFVAGGLFVGWIANMILGGSSRPDDWGPLIGAAIAGSFVGGLLINLIAGDGLAIRPSGLIGSIVGAVIVLAGYNAVKGRQK